MDDIEQKIEETKRELEELEQRKRDSAGQRISDRLAEYDDRLAECNGMLNTLFETGKKLEEDIKSFGAGLGKVPLELGKVPLKLDKVPPELRDELMRKGHGFLLLVQKVNGQLLFAAKLLEGVEGRRSEEAENFIKLLLDNWEMTRGRGLNELTVRIDDMA
jgi:hypothetical protein